MLRRGDAVIPLPPKAIDTLLALAVSGGKVVEKEELIKAVWPDTFVEEGGLARNISLLRRVIGEASIETVPRRGYRFVLPTSRDAENSNATRSLAVLPFANLSGDPAQEFFADGMTDELISYFLRVDALRVPSRTSAMTYKGANKALRQIARELNVQWVVEGAVLHAEGRVRISVRLIEGETETHLWSETYEKDMRDIIALQSELASDIAGQIRVKMTAPEKARLAQSRSIDPEAYSAYLRGRYFWNKRTVESLRKAREYFEKAIDLDPSYAPAHSGLADTYALMGSNGYDVMPPTEAMPRAKAAARNAVEIDPGLADAYAVMGYVKLVYDRNLAEAAKDLERAVALKPNYAIAHQWKGEMLMAKSQPEDATKAFRRALDLDPLSIPCNLGFGWSLYFWGKNDQAIEQFQKTLEMAPDVPMALYGLGLSFQQKSEHQRGFGEFQKAYVSTGGDIAAVMLMGVTHALAGRRQAAEQELVKLSGLAQHRYVPAIYSAFIHVALSDLDRAFEFLNKACEERSSYLVFITVQPSFDVVRLDPRYGDLLKRIRS